jgi:DNA polymerase
MSAVLQWWREAGVDALYEDEPHGWRASEPAHSPDAAPGPATPAALPDAVTSAPPPMAEPEPVMAGGPRADWPGDLAAFKSWWMTDASLGEGTRIAPEGEAKAKLMIFLASPTNSGSGGLLSELEDRLLSAMLRAMGIAREQTYIAAMLPAAQPVVDWRTASQGGWGDLALQHMKLAAPERAIVFARRLQPLLCGADTSPQMPQQMLDTGDAPLPALFSWNLEALAGSGARLAQFWNRWLDWTAR